MRAWVRAAESESPVLPLTPKKQRGTHVPRGTYGTHGTHGAQPALSLTPDEEASAPTEPPDEPLCPPRRRLAASDEPGACGGLQQDHGGVQPVPPRLDDDACAGVPLEARQVPPAARMEAAHGWPAEQGGGVEPPLELPLGQPALAIDWKRRRDIQELYYAQDAARSGSHRRGSDQSDVSDSEITDSAVTIVLQDPQAGFQDPASAVV
jgi:hypothetical protein